MHGYVRHDVVFQPGRVEFGQVPANEGASQQVSILYAGRDDWEISDVRSANTNFKVELRPAVRSNGRVQYDMVVHLKKDTPTGYINDQLTLVTNDDAGRLIPLSVEGYVAASISVSPVSLHLGVVRSGESVTKQLVVRGTSPFRIVQVACQGNDESFTFSPGNQQRKLHLIPVTFTAGDTPGKITEKIRITTQGDSDEDLEVTAHVEVLGN